MLRPALLAASVFVLLSCRPEVVDRNTSGGPLSARQAAFDVTYYDLSIRIDPDARRIEGVLRLDARLTAPLDSLELDLDDRLVVSAVRNLPSREEIGFVQLGGKLVFPLSAPDAAEPSPPARSTQGASGSTQPLQAQYAQGTSGSRQPSPAQYAQGTSGWTEPSPPARSPRGTTGLMEPRASAEPRFVSFEIAYGGVPRVAPNPPWDGGFTWKTADDGSPWFAVSCQAEGADLWWPVKDHPSDEPDSMRIAVTVPSGLTALSNGRLRSMVDGEGVSTFEWFVSTPINNYGVTLAVGPYERLAYPYRHADGLEGEIAFWVLPESRAEAERSLPHLADQIRFMEGLAGPFPFRADKLGFVQTPYLGMEHQTLIAYGDRFAKNAYGFDWLFLHELAHEWYGNLVTAADWKDMWLHEGFATYAEALYAEEAGGEAAYLRYMADVHRKIANRKPLAPRESRTTTEVYFTADLRRSDPDVYVKGAFVLHLLRYLGGREAIQTVLRRWAYPDPEWEGSTDCRACRLATSDEFIGLAEEILGRELGWFFEVLLREPAMPVLHVEERDSTVALRWEAPGDRVFPMPVDVEVGDRRLRLELPDGTVTISRTPGEAVRVDPDGWGVGSRDAPVRRNS